MQFVILNVEHGFAAYAIARDGSLLLFDCGFSSTVRPSDVLSSLGYQHIDHLFISHFDEDHIGDLPRIRKQFSIGIFTRNRSISSSAARQMKTVVTPAMKEVLKMHEDYVKPASFSYSGIQIKSFFNEYPEFKDSNNLSLLTFVRVGDVQFVLPGDLERAGWLVLLENPSVCKLLQNVDYFIASHHGRENGYCKEVFDFCTPRAVIFSDASIAYDTQEMANVYGQHALGTHFEGKFRKVLTTRNDGSLHLDL